jgi:hypothetical protein
MVARFDRDLWGEQVRAGLEAARDVAALRRRVSEDARNHVVGSAADDEEDALRRLADERLSRRFTPTWAPRSMKVAGS